MKKIFALLLALLMLVSAIPFAAAADHEHIDGVCDAENCTETVVPPVAEEEEVTDTHEHVDANGNGVCDAEGCTQEMPHEHYDDNGNGVCDAYGCTQSMPHDHYDANGNGVCDAEGCTETVEPKDPVGPGADDEEDEEDDSECAHKFTTGYKSYNATYHYRKCSLCKESIKTKHTFNTKGECTKCDYEKKGAYYVTLKETGNGDTKLSTRYADQGEYVYIYVNPDRNQKVEDIEVYTRYGYSYTSNSKCSKCTKYKTCNDCKYGSYYDYDFIEFSRYYDYSCSHLYNCNCSKTTKSTKQINVTKRSSVCYSFRMPASDVTVEVTYTGSSCEDNTYGKYTDVASTDWFYSAVNYVTNYEIMPGTSYTKFSPSVNMDRATVALALYNISGAKASGSEKFSDVDSDDWFYDAVVWCSNKGIIEGWNGKFDPYGEVTREDFAVMIHRYAEYKRYNTKDSVELDAFSDADKVSNYAVEALEWAVAEGLINGMGNGTLAPQGTTTRAQAAAVLMRFCKNVK